MSTHDPANPSMNAAGVPSGPDRNNLPPADTSNGSGKRNGGAGLVKRLLRIGWEMAVVAAVLGFVVYRLNFSPVPVDSYTVAMGPIVSEVMGTGTLEARVQATGVARPE